MPVKLTKEDFVQIDSTWICIVDGFHLSLSQNSSGDFKLNVYGSVEPIPKATAYPTEPEWERALALANKFKTAFDVADR